MAPDEGYVEINVSAVRFENEMTCRYKNARSASFSKYALFPHLNVWENIAYGLKDRPKEEVQAKVEQLLKTMNIDGLEGRYRASFPPDSSREQPLPAPGSRTGCTASRRAVFGARPVVKRTPGLELLDLRKYSAAVFYSSPMT